MFNSKKICKQSIAFMLVCATLPTPWLAFLYKDHKDDYLPDMMKRFQLLGFIVSV